MTKILITGGTGFIGRELISLLLKKGFEVGVLSREKVTFKNVQSFLWSRESLDLRSLVFADVVVHLAGTNVGSKRWSKSRKEDIISSRVNTAGMIRKALIENNIKIDAFISASAVGYYGDGGEEKLTESSAVVRPDFLSEVCVKWEKAAADFSSICRVASVRVGFVLGKNSDAFKKLVLPISMGFGAPLGNGKQYMSWVHLQDLTEIFLRVIEDSSLEGSINACSPNPLTNAELTKKIAHHLGRPLFMPNVPQFALKLLLGEMSSLALVGNRVLPEKLQNHGFHFQYAGLEEALKEVYP
jgi:uncharacterized protein (TIGR01777 family)